MTWTNYKTFNTTSSFVTGDLFAEWAAKCSNVQYNSTTRIAKVTQTNIITGLPYENFLYHPTNANYIYPVISYTSDALTDGVFGSFRADVTMQNAGTQLRCWESDENDKAFLITKGKSIQFFWPGEDQWIWGNSGWASGATRTSTMLCPFAGQYWRLAGYPGEPTGSSESYVKTLLGVAGDNYILEQDVFMQGLVFTQSLTTSDNTDGKAPLFTINRPDTLQHVKSSMTGSSRYIPWNSNGGEGIIIETGGKFYFRTLGDLGTTALCFEMGTTEPDMT